MDTLLPLTLFAFVSSITPGPNNIMLTSSGMRFGFLRTVPHLFGISFGFTVLMALCASGVGTLLLAMPVLHLVLKALGSAYLIYLAWQLRDMGFAQSVSGDVRPLSFGGAALFQFANPKAWMMGVTGASAFLPGVRPVSLAIALYCLVFVTVGFPCIALWAGAGAVLRRYLAQRRWQLLFCGVMIVLTLYSALAIWL